MDTYLNQFEVKGARAEPNLSNINAVTGELTRSIPSLNDKLAMKSTTKLAKLTCGKAISRAKSKALVGKYKSTHISTLGSQGNNESQDEEDVALGPSKS